jgi:hypothetical protein
MSPKRPRDVNALARQLVDEATGEIAPETETKNPAAVIAGRKGGLKGGRARAAKLTPTQRSEAARKAATARWRRHQSE